VSEKPSEEKKNIFDTMPENPALCESPWFAGEPCAVALFGKRQVIEATGSWSGHGFLAIFPINPDVPAIESDTAISVATDGEVLERIKPGPSIALVFPTAESALHLAETLKRLARTMLIAGGASHVNSGKEPVEDTQEGAAPSPAAEHAKTCATCRNRSIGKGGLCQTGWLLLAQETNSDLSASATQAPPPARSP